MKKIVFFVILTLSSFVYSKELTKVWDSGKIFKTPESVNYYAKENCLFVSNINGNPSEKDGNGFISKIALDGKVISLKWATGLNAPKGAAIYKNTMVVADIDRIVVIDVLKGKVLKKINISGAKFLNDVAVDNKGMFYISDSSATNSKIYGFNGEKTYVWLSGKNVVSPNGLFVKGDFLYFGSFKDKTIYKVALKTKKQVKLVFVNMGIDGLKMLEDSCFIFSDWFGHTAIECEGKVSVLLNTTKGKVNAADLEYIKEKNLVIIPTFFDNRCIAYRLK